MAGILAFLFFCSIQDIREKRISVKMLILSGVLFLSASLLFDDIEGEKRLYSMLPGIIAFLLAFLTGEQIGYGDAVCLIVLGTVISGGVLLGAIMGGLILLSAFSIILVTRKRADRKTTLPFLPFLSAGILWQIMAGGI